MKKRGRPHKDIDLKALEISFQQVMFIFLYYMEGGVENLITLKKLGLKYDEIRKLELERPLSLVAETYISEQYRSKLKEHPTFSEFELRTTHWILNRYISFKIINSKIDQGDFLTLSLEKIQDPRFETIKKIFTVKPYKSFSRKGGPKPLYEDYLNLRILDQIFERAYSESSIEILFNTIYTPNIIALLNELGLSVPSKETFRNNIQQRIRPSTRVKDENIFADQDAHLIYFPLLVDDLAEFLKESGLHKFWDIPTLRNEYLILKNLPASLVRKMKLLYSNYLY